MYVYVKVHEPRGLSNKFEGPFRIVSRPSRSQVEVRVGSFADGRPLHQTFHWSSCKLAHMREGAPEGSRPKLGRPAIAPQPVEPSEPIQTVTSSPAEPSETTESTASPVAAYFPSNSRPVRTTRNPHPQYVDAVMCQLRT